MTANGCSYKGGICREAVQACEGCGRKTQFASGWFCSACPDPSTKWKSGHCNLATHVTRGTVAAQQKINPLKASKRANR